MFSLRRYATFFLLGLSVALSGCASDKGKHSRLDPFAGKGSPYYRGSGPIPRGGGRYLVGQPYQVAGRWFTPREQPGYDKSGIASWYGEAFHRRQTSNGEYFDMAMLSAAHATLPLPSYAKVTNLENGRSIVVRINDRGPFVDSRVIDLSKRSAEVLGYKQKGMAKVRIQYIGPAPLNDKGPHLAMMNEKLRTGAGMRSLVAYAANRSPQQVQVAESSPPESAAAYQEASVDAVPVQRKTRDGYLVSVAAFSNIENADAAGEGLSTLGAARVFEVEGANGPLYLLQLGPFRSGLAARQARDSVIDAGFPEAEISTVRIQAVAANP